MGKVLKWIGIVLGAIIGLIVLAVLALNINTRLRLNRTYTVPEESVTIPTDAASLARGEHLVTVLCTGCHRPNLAGGEMINDPKLAVFYSKNLTSGQGGVGATLSDADFVRAIRHGVKPDGKPLFLMPAADFHNFSEADLGAVIAYLRTVPPVDQEWPEPKYGPLGGILVSVGAFGPDIIPAEVIDHNAPFAPAPAESPTADYGAYLVSLVGCRTCHGQDLTGGQSPEPGAPPSPNLTQGGELAGWTQDGFITTLRTGTTPSGRMLTDYMPWKELANMSDEELQALWAYVHSLPAS